MRDMDKKRANDRERIRRLSTAGAAVGDPAAALRREVTSLRGQLNKAEREAVERQLEDEQREALQRVVREVEVPKWLVKGSAPKGGNGVPVLELSDWHTGEVVRPELVGGKTGTSSASAFSAC